MEGLGEMDPSITQRLTLLVYDDIEAVHDHLVTVFGFGPGRLSATSPVGWSTASCTSATVWSGCTRPRSATASRRRPGWASPPTAWP